jgi:predicted double-glycine peptidase
VLFAVLAVLSLGQTATLDVPFVPQTEALCGGASVAMVFRYWGDAHADAGQFASLVEHRPGGVAGIAGGVLAESVRARGWTVESAAGSLDGLAARVATGQPVVVLLAERGNLYHYVVVVGASGDGVVVHDPSWGPFRQIATTEFERRWSATGHWSLVVLPADGIRAADAAGVPGDGARGFSRATQDPEAKTSGGELPQWEITLADAIGARRWNEAAGLARAAIGRDPHDEYARLVLGTSLFMLDDQIGALREWNVIGQPRLNEVNIEGLRRARYQTLTDALGLRPNTVLTADAFLQARHRLDELPDRAGARLALRPEDDGFASVDVVISERSGLPRGRMEWIGAGARAAINREIAIELPGQTGQGEMWSAAWRWWNDRPKVAVGFAAPHVAGLFGVWRVDASWETESYSIGGPDLLRETRGHGALTVSDWMSGTVRYSLTAGVDTWGSLKAVSAGAGLERQWLDGRLALTATATHWQPVAGGAAGFYALGTRAQFSSSTAFRGWRYQAAAGADRVSDNAPLTLWPGAGEGWARTPTLRAHRLLDDGAIDLSGRSTFGRSLGYGSVESQRWLERPALVKIAIAGFVDVAGSTRELTGASGVAQADVGAGLRLRWPGDARVLRIDVARGLRDGATALSVGWTF